METHTISGIKDWLNNTVIRIPNIFQWTRAAGWQSPAAQDPDDRVAVSDALSQATG